MKKMLVITICLTSCFSFMLAQQEYFYRKPVTPLSSHVLTKPEFQVSISQSQINRSLTSPAYQITTPGNYYLSEDVSFYPASPNQAATIVIEISSDNVSLDLNAKEISQPSTNNTSLVQGIIIDPGLNNVLIHNGSLNGLSGAGIIVGANCSNISIAHISVTNCGLGGMFIGYNPFDYASVYAGQEQIRVSNPANPPTNSTDAVILDTVYVGDTAGYFSGSSTQYAHAIGIQMADVKNFQLLNTSSNSNQYGAPTLVTNSSTDPGGYYVATRSGYMGCGINIIRGQNGYLQQCEASNNQGWCGYGFLFENCSNVDGNFCFANFNTGTGDPILNATLLTTTFNYLAHRDLGRAAGCMLHDSSGCSFKHCQADYNSGNRQTAGFWMRRYHQLTSPTAVAASQYFDPTMIPAQINDACAGSTIYIDLTNALVLPALPNIVPGIGTGYVTTTAPLYIVNAGSNWNHLTDCQATHNSSTYLEACGFLAQGGTNNWFTRVIGQSSASGSGPSAYSSSGLGNFDLGVGVWSLTEAPKYLNPYTNTLIEYAAGISLESVRLPLMDFNSTTQLIELQNGGSGNLIFLGIKVKVTTLLLQEYALPSWAESCALVNESELKENYGSCVGTGVGALLNGAFKSIIKENWLTGNHSCTTGTTTTICSDTASGIGAQGGYGLLDLATNSTSLILDNKAFANQIIRPLTVSCLGCSPTTISGTPTLSIFTEGANYNVTYTDSNLALPVETASIGDFSPFNLLTPYSNLEWLGNSSNPSFKILSRILVTSSTAPAVFTL